MASSGKTVCTARFGDARLSAARHKGDAWQCGTGLNNGIKRQALESFGRPYQGMYYECGAVATE